MSAPSFVATRPIGDEELVHERLGAAFGHAVSEYDTARRVEALIDGFLGDIDITRASVLDVGCGIGFFARALQARGAEVIACDIGTDLVARVRMTVGCECVRADALSLVDQFGTDRFDIVLSSECIEHTPSPERALQQMSRILKPGGRLSVSTPNVVWYPVVRLATLANMRPFDGPESFSTFQSMRRVLEAEGLRVIAERGLHLIPFQLKWFTVSRWCDERLQALRWLMINLCVLAEKPEAASRN
jgi:2-polyprenyl-3-methyl-5-hydroxy-6-metoxy-1,4-benzoquinol methylase